MSRYANCQADISVSCFAHHGAYMHLYVLLVLA